MDVHRALVEKGEGSVDWANEWTEVKYLGGRRFAARIYSKPKVFKYNGEWLKHKLIRETDKTVLISANAGVLIKSNGDVALIDPKHRRIRVLREEFAALAWDGSKWRPVLTTTGENLIKIESFEESDRIYARITYANTAGELVVEYLLIDGHMLKHNIKFTANRAGTYRLAQVWLIPVKRVRTIKERLEEHEITGRRELPPKTAIRFMHEGIAVTENLARLFEEDPETGELRSKIVKKVVLDLDGNRGKVAILYGDWDLGAGEVFELDPDTTTISPPTDDAWVYQRLGSNNYGSDDGLFLCDEYSEWYEQHRNRRTYVRFDLSSISSGVTINVAKIRLYYFYYELNDPSGKQTDVHRVTESWDESTITWNNQPSYVSTATSSTNIPSSYGWVEWDVTDDVQGMVDGTYDNYGWCIKFHTESLSSGYSLVEFYSKEYDGYDPELYVEYTTAVQYEKELSESISPSDTLSRLPSKSVSESLSLSDVKAVAASAVKSELLSLSDILGKVRSIYREHFETLTISDMKQVQAGLVKAEIISLSDVFNKIWSTHKALEELASLTDRVAKSPSVAKAEAISLADAIETLKVFLRVLEEAIALTDVLTKYAAVEKAEALSLSDIVYKAPAVPLSEALSLADKTIKSALTAKTEAIALADLLSKLASISRGESVALTDAFQRVWDAVRVYGEELSVSDLVAKRPGIVKAEVIELTDYVAKLVLKLLSESASLLDYYARTWSAHRALTESVSLTDVLEKLKAKFKTLVETVNLLDQKLLTISKTISESTQLTDVTIKQVSKLALETLSTLDSISKQTSALKAELMTLSDQLQRTWSAHKELAESIGLSDVIQRLMVILKVLEETLTLVDATERLRVVKTIARLLGPKRLLPSVREEEAERVLGHTGE